MRGAGGVLALAVAALIVCCSADPHSELDVIVGEHADGQPLYVAGHKVHTPDSLGGGSLMRGVREIRHSRFYPYPYKEYEYIRPYGRQARWPMVPAEYSRFFGDGFPKRNFDEIDRTSMNTFMKRNFNMPKRDPPYGFNFLDLDMPVSNQDQKRDRHDFPMDEIDLSNLPIGSKRSFQY